MQQILPFRRKPVRPCRSSPDRRPGERGNVPPPDTLCRQASGKSAIRYMPIGDKYPSMFGNVQIISGHRSTIDSGAYSPPRWAPVALAR